MPKLSKDFPAQLSLQVTDAMRIQLIAIGYLTGNGGEYATPARNLLHGAIQNHIEKLSPRERAEYDEILGNVRIRETRKLPGEENQKSPVS
ncbi:MAG: hypothetical protein EHM33_02050 [Chloroflexi bacterium]|nr:MAG: hypothetical protein EHM33_02050 [Chloroflexota bacterium]